MQQLVGLSCAVCGDRIDSTLEAEFCPACFGPVHLRCKRAGPSSETACAACGGNLAHPVGLAVRQEKEKAAAKAAAAARALAERPTGLQLAVRNGFRLLACVGLGYLLFQRPSMGTVEWYYDLGLLGVGLGGLGLTEWWIYKTRGRRASLREAKRS